MTVSLPGTGSAVPGSTPVDKPPSGPPGVARPVRPETAAAAAAGDPIAIFVTQYGADYSAERALRALPLEMQCRVLNEGPLKASTGNPSAVLMSRVRRAMN